MAKRTKATEDREDVVVEINEIESAELRFNVLGASPLIMHRYPFKAWQELLLPSIKENRAALEQTLKHQPYREYRESFYRNRDKAAKAFFHLPNGMFAGAIAQAAVDIPGAARAQIERLTRVPDVNIEVFGVPQVFCAMVRNSGYPRTPDVRTRPIFPQWACRVTVRYCRPQLTERAIGRLMGAAGLIVGVGDWRGEKGGPFGSYRIVNNNDPEFNLIVNKQGREPQEEAYNNPVFYDEDTENILTWFTEEVRRREQDKDAEDPSKSRRPKTRQVHIVDGSGGDETYKGVEIS
jgi:hypothetical protein